MISAPECIDLCATSSDDDSILADNEKPVTSLVIKKETGYREETLLDTLQTAGGEGSEYSKGNSNDIDLNNDGDDFNSNPSMERMSDNFSADADPVNSSDNAETIISILVVSPQDMELKSKPSGIRKNNVFTLNSKTVSIKSAKSDDNGAYIYKGNASRFYFYSKEIGCHLVHHDVSDDSYFYNGRDGNNYRETFVPKENVYQLTRNYRESKNNPDFSQMIATIRKPEKKVIEDYYLVIYKWKPDADSSEFLMPRHGNSK